MTVKPSISENKKYRKHALVFKKPSLTKQCFKDEANINSIMSKYESTGIVENISKLKGQYGDFTNIGTYQEAQNKIMLAQDMFDRLPSAIRLKFENDPIKFVEFTQNPDNKAEMQELGLLPKEKQPPEPPKEPLKDSDTNSKE